MSNFFAYSDGSRLNPTNSFQSTTFEPIPDKTVLRCVITVCEWAKASDEACQNFGVAPDYISVNYQVVDGLYKNRKIFQGLHIFHSDPKKADRAKRMFSAIDGVTNAGICAGGNLPANRDLARISNKPIFIKVGLMQNKDKAINFVDEIGVHLQQQPQQQPAEQQPPQQQYNQQPAQQPAQQPQQQPTQGFDLPPNPFAFDDGIPF